MRNWLGDESSAGWVDDELGMILNPQRRSPRNFSTRAREPGSARSSLLAAEEQRSASVPPNIEKQRS